MMSFGAHRRSDWSGSETVSISFNGNLINAASTDTVASALIAAGFRTFNTHPADSSPRGGFCFVGRCSDCMIIVDGQPGAMACQTPIHAGMRIETQLGLGHWAGTEQ